MSVPTSPISLRRPLSQGPGIDGETTGAGSSTGTGTGSWLEAISGVMGELLQSWGIIGALKKRGWGTGGRSTSNTPPPFHDSTLPHYEHIELSHLNIQCRENVDDGNREEGRIGGSSSDKVQRRDRYYDRPPRHSFHEGSSPHSYLLTALLVHSLKYGSGKSCSEPYCHLCVKRVGTFSSDNKLEDHKSVLLDSKAWKKLGPDHYAIYNRSISEESNCSQMGMDNNELQASCDNNSAHLMSLANLRSISNLSLSHYDNVHEETIHDNSLTANTSSYPVTPVTSTCIDSLLSFSESTRTAQNDMGQARSSDTSSCKETDASVSLLTDTGTLTDFLTGRTCCTSSFFGDDSYESATLTDGIDLPKDLISIRTRQKSSVPMYDLSTSVCSLPCRLGSIDDSTFERPVLSSGSLVMMSRRPSLSASIGTSATSHFRWEENPCYLRVEGARPGQGHDFKATTLDRPAWCDACAHLVFYHATTCGTGRRSMGLTESNQSRSSFWGPSKSKSSQFAEGIYEGKPRQAVTLPSRHITRNLNNSATSTDDCSLSIVNSRPPDFIKQKDHLLYVSDRELYNCPRSVPYTKHSDQVINCSNSHIKLAPNLKNNESPIDNDSIITQPRNRSRNISCSMKVSLSEASLINEDNVYISKRVRSRSHNYRKRDSSSSSRKSCNNGITLEEKETQTFPQVPHIANQYESKCERHVVHTQRRSVSCKEKSGPNGRRSRKNGKRIADNFSCSVPTTPSAIESDPYIYLHYENNPSQDKEYEEVKSVTAWRPGFSEACLYIPKKDENLNTSEARIPKRKKSQIIIQLDNKNSSQLENSDSKINNGAYKVCSNVWFESFVNDEGKKYFNGGNITADRNDRSYNVTCECEKNFSVTGFDHTDNEIGFRNKINRNNIPKYIAEKESQYNDENDLEEKSDLNIIVGNSPFGIQSCRFNQCPSLSNTKIDDVEMLSSTSGSHFNNNASNLQVEKDLILDNLKSLNFDHENSEEALEVSKSLFSPGCETKNSSNQELPASNRKLSDFSLNEPVFQKTNVIRSESLKEFANHSMNNKEKNVKPKHQFYSIPKENTHNYSQITSSFKSTTLPSHSFLSNAVFESGGTNVESQGGDINMNKTKSSRNLISGTFPLLRLPKPATQPKLVDVLRKENGKINYAKVIKRAQSMDSLTDAQSKFQNCSFNDNTLGISKESDISSSIRKKFQLKSTTATVYNKCIFDTVENKKDAIKTFAPDNNKSNINLLNMEPKKQSESFNQSPSDGCVQEYKNKTIPIGKNFNYRQKIKRFFSLRLKHVEKIKSNKDCSLMCHEQCQGVVSLDCKMDSPDTDLQFHDAEPHVEDDDVSNLDFFPLEDNENPVLVNESYESLETVGCEEDVNVENEDNVEEEGEEEKHEEEMLEKEIIFEQEMSSMKKQEVSTLRRTVRRIQSQAVDSAKIEEWVQKCPANNVGLQITKEEDGGYRGCLRIHLNLSRPINIVTGTRPPSIYDILQEERTLEKTLTSFYMPRDIVKAIHITSKTTTREVIVALLRKFKVVDNPQKFALYERTYDTGQSIKAKLRRLSDNECPLVLAIAWNAQDITNKRLVLQENDTADIQWEAFSLPELDNFLRILDREEGEYKNQIKDKYSLLRYRIQLQLSRLNT